MPRGPNGLTHRQETFCRYFVLYGSTRTAALEAGYKSRWAVQHGRRLLRQPAIRRRVAGIQAEMARDSCREADVLLGKLEAVYRRAMDDHHFYAAARAVELQSKMIDRLSLARRAAAAGAGPTADPSGEALPAAAEAPAMGKAPVEADAPETGDGPVPEGTPQSLEDKGKNGKMSRNVSDSLCGTA